MEENKQRETRYRVSNVRRITDALLHISICLMEDNFTNDLYRHRFNASAGVLEFTVEKVFSEKSIEYLTHKDRGYKIEVIG